jgi:hypothetical protein
MLIFGCLLRPPHRGTQADRNIVQAGLPWEEDPALPVFFTLTRPLGNPPWRISK